jgi:hypothetical protein
MARVLSRVQFREQLVASHSSWTFPRIGIAPAEPSGWSALEGGLVALRSHPAEPGAPLVPYVAIGKPKSFETAEDKH